MLLAAAVVLAGMAAAGLLIAAAFTSVERRFEDLSTDAVPAMQAMLNAAQASAQVVAGLPHLTSAETQYERQNAQFSLAQRVAMLAAHLEGGAGLLGPSDAVGALEAQLASLESDIAALNDAIFARIEADRQIAAAADALASRRAVLAAALPDNRDWTVALTWVLEIGRIDRAMIAAGVQPQHPRDHLDRFSLPGPEPRISGDPVAPLSGDATAPLLLRLAALAADREANGARLDRLTERLRHTAARLSVQMHQAIERTHDRWQVEALAVERRLTALGRALVILAALMIVVMGLFLWLYVGRRLIGRITRLSAAARRLSAGDLDVAVSDPRRDELAELARAMVLFRDAMAALSDQARELADRNAEIDRTNRELDRLSRIDPLTGAYNRRYLIARMEQPDADTDADPAVAGEATEATAPLSLLVIDLDRFKAINDLYGHAAGDEALRRFARTCLGLIRRGDVMARYGGEEFVVLMPGARLADAAGLAERLRVALAGLVVPAGDRLFGFTVSIGAAERMPGEPMTALLRRADDALYRAKQDGRNRVETAESAVA